MDGKKNEIILFENQGIKLEVNLKDETLWLNGQQIIDNNTLAALTLLIAESNPKEKEVIIDLVMNFLNDDQFYYYVNSKQMYIF